MRRLSTMSVRTIMAILCALMLAGSSMSSMDVLAQSQSPTGEFLEPKNVHYYDNCGQFWPSSGVFKTETDGIFYSATLVFSLTQEEKDNLLCVNEHSAEGYSDEEYIEIEFQIFGFDTPTWWEQYDITTNMPRGIKDTPVGDNPEELRPAITGIKVEDLDVGVEYYAGITFDGQGLGYDDDETSGARVSYIWQVSHWATTLNPYEEPYCLAENGAPEWCVFKTADVFLSHGYTNLAYGEKQSMPFVFGGDPNVEFPITVEPDGPLPTLAPEALPTIADSTCIDEGAPYITSGLSYWPENPDTATQVELSVTMSNNGCGPFQPAVLAIAGRAPGGVVSDPLQDRNFALRPGESRTITVTTVLSTPGTHEFWMGFMQADGDWHEIPDTSGVSHTSLSK